MTAAVASGGASQGSGAERTTGFESLTVTDLTRHFGRRRALSGVTFTAASGSILGLLGPNGAGKSTLLAMLATLLRPTSGSIRYGSLATISGEAGITGASDAALRAAIGMLGHDLYLYPELTAHENLAFFAGLYGSPDAAADASRALERARLADRADDAVGSFSRGMRQRVALERALIHDPSLVLLDEPFTGLDARSVGALTARLRELRGEGRIILLATHDLDLAEGLFDQAVFIRDGRMVELASQPQALRTLYHAVMEQPRA